MTGICSLPLDILWIIGRHLNLKEYHIFRLSSTKFELGRIPTVTYESFTNSLSWAWVKHMFEDPSQFIKLSLDYFNSHQFIYLAMNGYTSEFLRILQLKGNCISSAIKQLALVYSVDPTFNARMVFALLNDIPMDTPILIEHTFRQACKTGHANIVNLLLNSGCIDPGANQNYSIVVACYHGHTDVVRMLIKHPKVDPSDMNNNAILIASHGGHHDIVRMLLEDNRVDPTAQNSLALSTAAINGHTTTVSLLLKDNRANPAVNDNMLIINAAERGNIDICKLLLNHSSVDPTIENNKPLRLAVQNGHEQIVELLIPKCDVDVLEFLPIAALFNQPHVIRVLLDNKNLKSDHLFHHSLCIASRNGHSECVDLLLKDGRVDPNMDKSFGFQHAALNGHYKVIKCFQTDGRVDFSMNDNMALRLAIENGYTDVVRVLLDDIQLNVQSNINHYIQLTLKFKRNDIYELLMNHPRIDKSVEMASMELANNQWTINGGILLAGSLLFMIGYSVFKK
ncbi:ankyrin repeat-containing domain protein [Globomyces pollinis-pini]|nr:ankyrin repeat-containing domain protein [Globomyces pollinis-pini]